MTFTITYRDAGGAMREESVEAASRADALSALKARGISPISLRSAKPGGPQSLAAADATGRVPPSRGRDGAPPSHSLTRQLANSLTAIAALAAIALGTWLYLSRRPHATPTPPDNRKMAPVEDLSAMPTNMSVSSKQIGNTKRLPKDRRMPKTYRDERGILRYEGGMRAHDPSRPHHVAKTFADPLNAPVFKTRPENEIAMLLTAKPGDTILMLRRYDDAFEAEFLKSLENNVEISEDDTPDRAELKRVMAETKKELSERMANGEKLADILEETRSELRRLADYRKNIEKMVLEAARSPDMSEQDINDCVLAANKMLEENGIKPVRSSIVRKNLAMKARMKRREGAK